MKLPLARDSIMLGVNQGIIMVLAVVVIGGLVGSGALGDLVARGLQRNEFGLGVVASLAILALGIALDRVTQGKRRQSQPDRRGSLKTHRRTWAVVMALMLALFVAACGEEKDDEPASGGGDGGSAAAGKDCGKVVLNEQAWAGSTANTYIAKAVLEDELGCEVEVTKVAEIPVFQAMADGKVDAVLEDWQHVDEYEQYIEKAKTVVQGGPLGVEGHIGWFVPKYVMDENPEFKTWEGLKGKEDVFKRATAFLGGDPSYVQKDKQLIEALGLDFKHVTAGAEPAQVARWSQAYKQEEPVLFYWYTPQYLNQEYELAEVKLPPRTEANKDCKDDAKEGGDPEQYKCEYDITVINKLFSKKFADSGSPAYDVLRKMKLTNEDQELVAKAIAGDKQDPEEAGADWVADNQDTVQQWLE